jgi:hypothetical protein
MQAYGWLRYAPPGAVLELPVFGPTPTSRRYASLYHYATMWHGHAVLNSGIGARRSVLHEFLGGPDSPLLEVGQTPELLRALRSLGVRYIVFRAAAVKHPTEADAFIQAVSNSGNQVAEHQVFQLVHIWRLNERSAPRGTSPALHSLPAAAILASRAAANENILPLMLDGIRRSAWASRGAQRGGEWIRLELDRPRDIAQVRLHLGPGTLGGYPRRLQIESTDGAGVSRILYEDSVLEPLLKAVVERGRFPRIDLDLGANSTGVLILRQTGAGAQAWTVNELELMERGRPAP